MRQFPPDPSKSNDSLFKSEPETETETDSVFATLKKRNLGKPSDVGIKLCVPIISENKYSGMLL